MLILYFGLLNADCIFDIYGKSNYDIYDPALTQYFRSVACDCLSNILANTSDTSSSCNKVICAIECGVAGNGFVSWLCDI